MKQAAAVTILAFVAGLAAVLFLRSAHERAAVLEQAEAHAQARHEDLIRHLGRLEHMLEPALSRDEISRAAGSQAPLTPSGVPSEVAKQETAPTEPSLEERAQREASIREANDIVDRAIQAGEWTTADVVAFGRATTTLSGADRAEIWAKVAVAVNSGRAHLNTR